MKRNIRMQRKLFVGCDIFSENWCTNDSTVCRLWFDSGPMTTHAKGNCTVYYFNPSSMSIVRQKLYVDSSLCIHIIQRLLDINGNTQRTLSISIAPIVNCHFYSILNHFNFKFYIKSLVVSPLLLLLFNRCQINRLWKFSFFFEKLFSNR